MGKKVIVGMSGGVDSSVTAYLLKEQGYEVIGVTMHIWQDSECNELEGESEHQAVHDARTVAKYLDIPFYIADFKELFRQKVIDHFVHEYEHGRTPNPCNVCNRMIKWEALLEYAGKLGADYVATGHYANILQLPNGRYSIANAKTARKDQTYALYNLTQEQLAHTLMPLGKMDKDETRAIAEKIGLPVANKPDSQDICFVADGNYQRFIEDYTGRKMPGGQFIYRDGKRLGEHQGICHYTIGQRKGLNLSMGHPVFVTDIDADTHAVKIGESEDLFHCTLIADEVNMMGIILTNEPIKLEAKIRYAHQAAACTAWMTEDGLLEVVFDLPQRAITPGQAVVLYDDGCVAAGGIIKKVVKK